VQTPVAPVFLIDSAGTTAAAKLSGKLDSGNFASNLEFVFPDAVRALPVSAGSDHDEDEPDPDAYFQMILAPTQPSEQPEPALELGSNLEAMPPEQTGGSSALSCPSDMVLNQVAYWTSQIRSAEEELTATSGPRHTLLLAPIFAAMGAYFLGRWYRRTHAQKSRQTITGL
jgi:hypothetical protein